MSLRNKVLPLITAVGLSALILTGCSGKPNDSASKAYTTAAKEAKEKAEKKAKEEAEANKMVNYAGGFDISHFESGVAITSGDFDGDGDLDLVIAGINAKYYYTDNGDVNNKRSTGGRLYFFENDGKGNFTLKQYVKGKVSGLKQ